MKARVEVANEACTGCATCIDSCPMDVFRLIESDMGHAVAKVEYPDDCEGCFLCIIDCPRDAIRLRMEN